MRTMREVSVYVAENKSDLLFDLYERWGEEKEYEDFNDYIDVVKKNIVEVYKGTKNPFTFIAKCSDGKLEFLLETAKSGKIELNFYEIT